MAERRVLLIDSDKTFHETLTRALARYGITVHVVDDGSDGLGLVPKLEPEIIFIAVELPAKVGYSICNKAKKGVAKKIPVVLTTATVPRADMAQHRQLPKVHADEYIDKRSLTVDELIAKVDGLVSLGPPVEDGPMEELQVDAEDIQFDEDAEPPAHAEPTNVAPPHLVDPGIDEETDAVFAGIMDRDEPLGVVESSTDQVSEPVFDAAQTGVRSAAKVLGSPPPLPPPAATTEPEPAHAGLDLGLDAVAERSAARASSLDAARIAELEDEVARLGRDLEEARRAPAPAPTSFTREREFLNLREVINRKEKEILDLREEVDTKERFILGGKDKIRELERKLRDTDEKLLGLEGQVVTANESAAALREDKDKALERERGLKARIDIAQKQLSKADEEFENLKRRSTAEGQALQAEVAARKRELAEEKKNTADRVAGLEAVHAAALKKGDSDRQAQLARAAEDKEAALAALRREGGDQLEKAKAAHDAVLAGLRAEQQRQLQALAAEKDQALARADKERKDQLARAAEERAQALADATRQREHELAEAEDRRAAEIAASEELRRHQVTETRDAGQHALEELRAAKEAELARLADEMRAALAGAEERRQGEAGAAEAKLRDELAGADERRKAELAAAEERRMKELFGADSRRREELAAAADGHARELGALIKSHEEKTAQHHAERTAEVAELKAEIASLQDGLGTTRTKLAATETELGRTANALRDRDAQVARLEADLAERDRRLGENKVQIADLERENASFQEQLLRAYQKIKSDEAVALKAKKAMAIALTLLDGEAPKPAAESHTTEG
jgi:CheY-like chemotaxis protein